MFFFDLTASVYNSYAALLNQTGTDAPTATVIYNGLSGLIVWTRFTNGEYRGTLAGAFPAGKTLVFITNSTGGVVAGTRLDDNTINIITSGDSVLINASLKIEVYP